MPWSRNARAAAFAAILTAGAAFGSGANAADQATPAPKPSSGATRSSFEAAHLLRASVLAPESVSYVGQLQTIRFSTSRASATIVRIEHLAPDRTRKWYLAPESLYGDYTITRGITTYQFDTKHSRIVTSRNPSLENQVAAAGSLGLITQNYRAVLGDEETIAGHNTVSVMLINKYTGERAVRVWIDPETDLVLKKEQYRGNGAVAAQSRFEELRYTASIPSDIFSTAVPAGYAEVLGRDYASPSKDLGHVVKDAGFTPIIPKFLPEGFNLVSGDVATVSGVKELHFLYSDGLRSLSLFENAVGAAADFGKLKPTMIHFEDHDGQYVEEGPTTLLVWQEHSLHFALVSDLALRDIVEIAISVIP
jgi:outer membrane lipoprotein-sorting protein